MHSAVDYKRLRFYFRPVLYDPRNVTPRVYTKRYEQPSWQASKRLQRPQIAAERETRRYEDSFHTKKRIM